MSNFKSSKSVAHRKHIYLDKNDPKAMGFNYDYFSNKAGAKIVIKESETETLELGQAPDSSTQTLWIAQPYMHLYDTESDPDVSATEYWNTVSGAISPPPSSESWTLEDLQITKPTAIKYSMANSKNFLFIGLGPVFALVINELTANYVSLVSTDGFGINWNFKKTTDGGVLANYFYKSGTVYNISAYSYMEKFITNSFLLQCDNALYHTISASTNYNNYVAFEKDSSTILGFLSAGNTIAWQKNVNILCGQNSCLDANDNIYMSNSDIRDFNLLAVDKNGLNIFAKNYIIGNSGDTGSIVKLQKYVNNVDQTRIVAVGNINNNGLIVSFDLSGNIISCNKIAFKINDIDYDQTKKVFIITGDNNAAIISTNFEFLQGINHSQSNINLGENSNIDPDQNPASCIINGNNVYINGNGHIIGTIGDFRIYPDPNRSSDYDADHNPYCDIIISIISNSDYLKESVSITSSDISVSITDSSDITAGVADSLFGSGF